MAEIRLRTVLITGADRGLGYALAARFLRGGFQVLAGARGAAGDRLASLAQPPHTVVVVPLDVADLGSIRQAFQWARQVAPFVDILINNAGVHLEPEVALEALDLDDSYLEATMAVNAFGPLRVTQQFLPLLERGQGKLILNISSDAGSIADCGGSREFAYCMSKAALNMQSKLLWNYLAPRGYRVLTVHPGWVRTDMGGPNATVSPDDSADGIFNLATQGHQPPDEIYLDYRGKPLRW